MTLPPREIGRRLDQQAHDIEDAYRLLTELRTETTAGFAQVDERLNEITGQLAQVDGQLAQVDGRLAQVDDRFAQVDDRFAQVDGRLAQMDDRFAQIDGHLDHHGQLLVRILHLLDDSVPDR